jgi:hypothetical protein
VLEHVQGVCSTAAVDYWTVLSQKYLDEFCANSAATKLIWNSSASSLVFHYFTIYLGKHCYYIYIAK